MPKQEWRDVSIQNGQVREVHRIDNRRIPVYYGIYEWADLMIEGHTTLVKGPFHRLYLCRHYGIKKQFLCLNLHRQDAYKSHTDNSGTPLPEKLYPNLLDNYIVEKLHNGGGLVEPH